MTDNTQNSPNTENTTGENIPKNFDINMDVD
jgi:hypothetical protein